VPHDLHLDELGHVAEIVLDAPRENSLDRAAILGLHELLEDLSRRESLRAVILTGANGNFCGGRIRDLALVTKEEIATDLAPILAMNSLIESYPVPLIAAVEGVAYGFGFGLATLCDIAVAGEGARFALTELAHGIPPLIVMSYLFRFLPYKVAFDLALTGREVGSEEAAARGLLTEVCPSGQSLVRARARAEHVAGLDAEAIGLLRSFARANAALVDGSAASGGADRIASLLATR